MDRFFEISFVVLVGFVIGVLLGYTISVITTKRHVKTFFEERRVLLKWLLKEKEEDKCNGKA